MKRLLIIFFVFVLFILSCAKDKAELIKDKVPSITYCDSMKAINRVSYKCYVDSVLKARCVICHKQGGIGTGDFNSYYGVKLFATSISDRIQANPPSGGQRMPRGGPYLPDSVIALIQEWIKDGAKDN